MRWPLLSRLGQDVRLTTGSVVRSMCDVEVWMRDVAGDGVVGREVRATERLRVLSVEMPCGYLLHCRSAVDQLNGRWCV